jgi:DNA-binding beta-propeller fold protein YncE
MSERKRRPSIAIRVTAVVLLVGAGVHFLSPNKSFDFSSAARAETVPVETIEQGEMCLPNPVLASLEAAIPQASRNIIGGDVAPIRTVEDPYYSLHSVSVDPTNNRVVMTDSNRGGILFYDRNSGTKMTSVTEPLGHIRGPATGMMFVAGVAIDPGRREVFTVDNDIGDRMMVFPYDAEGNIKPRRVLAVPHGAWGLALNLQRDEIAISVEHPNTVVVFKRDAKGLEAPKRVIHGPHAGLEDPHGIVFDVPANEILVANHGNWAPLDREAAGDEDNPIPGRFDPPSITSYPGEAEGDVRPTRTIQGSATQLNWPMGISLDTVHDEIAVANYGNNSILIFHRTDNGNVAPVRVIRGDQTGVLGPMGVAFDTQNDELWVTNYRDHSAVVFGRDANGNVAPKRILRNAPPGTPAVGFGNPGAIAYDSKRKEILVPN